MIDAFQLWLDALPWPLHVAFQIAFVVVCAEGIVAVWRAVSGPMTDPPPGAPWMRVTASILIRPGRSALSGDANAKAALALDPETFLFVNTPFTIRELHFLLARTEQVYVRPSRGARLAIHIEGYCTFHADSFTIRHSNQP